MLLEGSQAFVARIAAPQVQRFITRRFGLLDCIPQKQRDATQRVHLGIAGTVLVGDGFLVV